MSVKLRKVLLYWCGDWGGWERKYDMGRYEICIKIVLE